MKKLLLGLGTLAAIVAPITTIVACGTTTDTGGAIETPTTPDNGNQNPGTDETLVNDEQTRVNAFVSTGATEQNEVVANSMHFTTEIGLKYGLSVELHTNTFSYEYTSTTTGITIMVTKVSDESKPTVVPTEISVAPFSGISKEILNSITQAEVTSAIDALVIVDNKILPKDLTNLPESVQITPLSNVEVTVIVDLTWTKDNDTGSIKWVGTIAGRTNADLLAATMSGFKTTATEEQEKAIENANSVTQEQIASKIGMDFDKTRLPSQVLPGLQTAINITPTTDDAATVFVNLEWTKNDSNGSLKWTANISNRTNHDALTGTIIGFKDTATANSEAIVNNANSITQSQVETIVNEKVKPDSTKLPSQVATNELPTTVEVHPTSDPSAVVVVSLLWNKNDSNGSLKWTANINDRTNPDDVAGTISGFKTTSTANSEAIVDNANSITQNQVETAVNKFLKSDSTKLPSQVLPGLQTTVNITPTTHNTTTVVANLGWATNDAAGTITWTATINDRDNATKLTGTISGFKDKATWDQEKAVANANSITREQIASKIGMDFDKTKLPSQVVVSLPNQVSIIPTIDNTATVVVDLTWTPDDAAGTVAWTAKVIDRNNDIELTETFLGFKDKATADHEKVVATANSITQNQVETSVNKIVKSDSTKLPSQITGLPTTVNVTPINSPTSLVVNLSWAHDDAAGTITWTATIDLRTNTDALVGTISSFKNQATANHEKDIANANSITSTQIASKIGTNFDKTKLPSKAIMELPSTVNVAPIADDTASIIFDLTWAPDDVAGTVAWTATTGIRNNGIELIGVVSGFKDTSSEDRKAILATIIIDGNEGSGTARVDQTKYPEWISNITLSGVTTNLSNGNKFTINVTYANGHQGSAEYEYTVSDLLKFVSDSDILSVVSARGASGSAVLVFDEPFPEGVATIRPEDGLFGLISGLTVYVLVTYEEGYTGNDQVQYVVGGLDLNVLTKEKVEKFLRDEAIEIKGKNGSGEISKILDCYFSNSVDPLTRTGLSNGDVVKVRIDYDWSSGYAGPQEVDYIVSGLEE